MRLVHEQIHFMELIEQRLDCVVTAGCLATFAFVQQYDDTFSPFCGNRLPHLPKESVKSDDGGLFRVFHQLRLDTVSGPVTHGYF